MQAFAVASGAWGSYLRLVSPWGRTPKGERVISLGVVRLGDGWTIVAAGRRWGRFAYKVDAEEAALRLARRIREAGDDFEIVVQERWGEMIPLAAPMAS